MFEMGKLNERLQELRKAKKMTQEDLADRLGVTSQAVSKWETGLSYPDITLLPSIVTILETDMDYLFGKKPVETDKNAKYPQKYDGLSFVHIFGNIVCYSDKEVESTDGSGVRFADGSTAELSNFTVSNIGKGEVKLLELEDIAPVSTIDQTKTEFTFDGGDSVENINIAVLANLTKIERSSDDKTHVIAKGTPEFISIIEVKEEGNTLEVNFNKNEQKRFEFADYKKNSVIIYLPCDQGKTANIAVNGCGEANITVPFELGNTSINGSGVITCNNKFNTYNSSINGSGVVYFIQSNTTNCSINGSGSIKFDSTNALNTSINGSGRIKGDHTAGINASINGSGSITAGENTGGDINLNINGSGNMKVCKGECGKAGIIIKGSGDVDLTDVTANTAAVEIHNKGKVIIGRVIEGTVEKIKKGGELKILRRQ